MTKFVFTSESFDGTVLTMEFEKEQLNDVLEQFEMFLRGTGFVFDGTLDFLKDDVKIDPPPFTIHDSKDYEFEINLADGAYDFYNDNSDFNINVEQELCPVCLISKDTMKVWNCHDKACPKVNNAN